MNGKGSKRHWKVLFKGDWNGSYELSVVRKDYSMGLKSWGWGCEHKIILFGTNLGCNHINPMTPEKKELAINMAKELCKVLNGDNDSER